VEEALRQQFELSLPPVDAPMSVEMLRDLLQNCDALCPTVTDRIDQALLSTPNIRVRLLANYGVGYEHIDLAAAAALGIRVSNTPDVLTDCTADLTLALMLAVARRLVEGDRAVRAGNWAGWRPTHMLAHDVSGKTLGIVGLGRIGLAVALRAHAGFGMRVQAYAPRWPDASAVSQVPVVRCGSLEQLLETSDFVSLHCPSNRHTRHLMNEQRLRCMRASAFLINTARGNIVDETALRDALQRGVIAGAALDVYEHEPKLTPGLIDLPNVVLAPHLGSATHETRIAMGMRALRNLEAFFAGKPLPDPVPKRAAL
jgi:lactate dehydrogenase-like 2-hydroxyacid dehydrogenase